MATPVQPAKAASVTPSASPKKPISKLTKEGGGMKLSAKKSAASAQSLPSAGDNTPVTPKGKRVSEVSALSDPSTPSSAAGNSAKRSPAQPATATPSKAVSGRSIHVSTRLFSFLSSGLLFSLLVCALSCSQLAYHVVVAMGNLYCLSYTL